jgi:hypothetical protein
MVLCGGLKPVYGLKMSWFRALLLLGFVCCLGAGPAIGAPLTHMRMDQVVICPASSASPTPPDFLSPNCQTVHARKIDPQNTLVWVKARLDLPSTVGPNGEPLALIVSGKMSSVFFLNGSKVGQNGMPGTSKDTEIAGLMDAVLYPPQTLFRTGENEIVFLASSHHGFLRLKQPIHAIAIGPSESITNAVLRHYWPSLLTLGLFILGALYFGGKGLVSAPRKQDFTLAVICMFAAAQLVAEVTRGLLAYPYPIHDLRLVLITVFSAGFGFSVAFYIWDMFAKQHKWLILSAIGVLCVSCILLANGYDSKAKVAMAIPLLASLGLTGFRSYQQRPGAFLYFLTLLSFIAAIIALPFLFLDVLFFYLVAGFLLLLLIDQGLVLAREARQRRIEKARGDRLELALEQAAQREEASEIVVNSAGKIERFSTDQILHCRGAGGYSEICLTNGRIVLHSSSLAGLEDVLPSTFLRVHRSHLVNTAFVKTLTRDPSGTGNLMLEDGSEIPVSRRVMPQVRQALG